MTTKDSGEGRTLRSRARRSSYFRFLKARLQRVDGVREVTETIYEPETTAFGGPAGMDAAHRLFHADTRHLLDKMALSWRELHRELPVLLASRMLRAARQEWYEQGDCWAQLAQHRSHSRAPGHLRSP